MIDYPKLRNWWSQQARTLPTQAGILAVDNELESAYRQYAEWRHFRQLVRLKQNMNVLEVGCGGGRWALLIAPHVKHVTAVDFSDEMIRVARQRQQQAGVANLEFVTASAAEFMSSLHYHIIYFSGVLQYLDDDDCRRAIRNAVSMLAPGGTIIDRSSCATPNREVCNNGAYQAIYRTKEELKSMFQEFGFRLTYHSSSYRPMRLPGRLLVKPRVVNALSWCMRQHPVPTYLLVRIASVLVNWLRPLPQPPSCFHRSHDFFRFELASGS